MNKAHTTRISGLGLVRSERENTERRAAWSVMKTAATVLFHVYVLAVAVLSFFLLQSKISEGFHSVQRSRHR